MNTCEYRLLKFLKNQTCINQRELAELLGYSLGKVNASLRMLLENGYVNDEYLLTEKALHLFDQNKPKQAVILAAGLGMRMVPINTETPKGLLEVKGEHLIERVIKQLNEVGISKITIVVGFMKERYEYLIDKYGVELIYNKEYADKNNWYSLYLVRDRLDNAYVIPCDLWCKDNPFSQEEICSWYMVNDVITESSNVRINNKQELRLVNEVTEGITMIGIAYVNHDSAVYIKRRLHEMIGNRNFIQSFWEAAAVKGKKMVFYPKIVEKDDVVEINTFEELRELDKNSNHLNSDLLNLIVESLRCNLNDITEIESLKKGMTNRSFRFRCKKKRYIMRVPGEGTDLMINRMQEYDVYQIIKRLDICDPIIYLSKEKGYKITEYLEGARTCNAENLEEVTRCMGFLKRFHQMNLNVEHTFNIFEQIEKYESYWNGENSSFGDYLETKHKMYELKKFIDQQDKEWTLTHIDAVPDNFLFVKDKIYLIDWEYAGMQDPHVDIAMFAIYAMYDRDKVESLIDAYFDNACPENTRTKIYCYIAVCGFLWSNWCEYKRICGVEFGEYSLRQYRFAKEYYKIAKERIEHE